jgi:SNF2 family DNA or RNA helicase
VSSNNVGEMPLWNHQARALAKALNSTPPLDCLGIFFEIGTGKSRTAIEILRHLCARDGKLQRTLIFCPKIVCTNWKREICKYSRILERDIVILSGAQGRRVKEFIQATEDSGILKKPKIVITNYEAATMEKLFPLMLQWIEGGVIIADEAHRLKNPESKRAKNVIQLGDVAAKRYPLTGTPILNSAMDIFNIFRFLDRGETFGKNFWKFRNIWFEDDNASWSGRQGYFPKYTPRIEMYQEFNRLIYRKAVVAKKSECLDLPPFVREAVYVELSAEQKKLYNQMRDDYIAWLDGENKEGNRRAVVAQMAVTKALRLQQIVTGYAKADDGSIHRIKDNPRLEALTELLKEHASEHKIIVWSVFHENYSDIGRVCEDLGIGFTELHGLVKDKDRTANVDRFTKDPKCRVLIGNQSAGGIGINLVESDLCIYYSKNFSLEHDLQSEGRNYRGGSEQHKKVTRIDIVAQDTIDNLIADALANKQDISRQILDWKDKL